MSSIPRIRNEIAPSNSCINHATFKYCILKIKSIERHIIFDEENVNNYRHFSFNIGTTMSFHAYIDEIFLNCKRKKLGKKEYIIDQTENNIIISSLPI